MSVKCRAQDLAKAAGDEGDDGECGVPGAGRCSLGQLLSSSGQRFPFSLTLGRYRSLGVRGKACRCPRVLSWTHCQVWKAMLAQGLKKGEHAQACTQTTAGRGHRRGWRIQHGAGRVERKNQRRERQTVSKSAAAASRARAGSRGLRL